MLENGLKVDEKAGYRRTESTALLNAVRAGDPARVASLLALGADPSQMDSSERYDDVFEGDVSISMIAAMLYINSPSEQRLKIIELLLSSKPNLNSGATFFGRHGDEIRGGTLMDYITEFGNSELHQMLGLGTPGKRCSELHEECRALRISLWEAERTLAMTFAKREQHDADRT